jgi:hypothetical protein
MAGEESRMPEETVAWLRTELNRVSAELDALKRVAEQALRLLSPDQFRQLRAALDDADRKQKGTGGCE